jgi:hypothetical protein
VVRDNSRQIAIGQLQTASVLDGNGAGAALSLPLDQIEDTSEKIGAHSSLMQLAFPG